MPKTRARAVWGLVESAFGSDPDATGAGYLYIPALSVGDLADTKDPLPTNYFNNENFPTAPIPGPDGWSFDLEFPLIGLASAAGAGTNASTVTADWLDMILLHIFGATRTTAGVAATGGSTTTITAATDPYDNQDVIAIFRAAVPAGAVRSQIARILSAASPYTVSPTLASAPTAASVAYGGRHYQHNADGGATLAFVYRDDSDVEYTCTGGRVTSYEITGESRGIWRMKVSISGDNKTLTTKGDTLPDPAAPATTPLIVTLSPIAFNGAFIETRMITIAGNLTTDPTLATSGVNGRSGWINVSYEPTITIEPLRTDALLNFKRDVTRGDLTVQLGAGVLAGGALNVMSVHANEVYARSVAPSDDNGRARQTIEFAVTNPGNVATNVLSRKFQVSRF